MMMGVTFKILSKTVTSMDHIFNVKFFKTRNLTYIGDGIGIATVQFTVYHCIASVISCC